MPGWRLPLREMTANARVNSESSSPSRSQLDAQALSQVTEVLFIMDLESTLPEQVTLATQGKKGHTVQGRPLDHLWPW